jgi:hypothetical protein
MPKSYELSLTVVVETPTFQGARLEGNVTLTDEWLEAPSHYTGDRLVCHIAEMMAANVHAGDEFEAKALLTDAATFVLTSDLGPQIKSFPVWPVDVTLVLTPESPEKCDWIISTQDYASYLVAVESGEAFTVEQLTIDETGTILDGSHRNIVLRQRRTIH